MVVPLIALVLSFLSYTSADKLPRQPRQQEPEQDPFVALSEAIPGVPGEDYPIFDVPPETQFSCDGYIQGYYADPEADCQSFHICVDDGNNGMIKYSFLCPNGTLFQQQ